MIWVPTESLTMKIVSSRQLYGIVGGEWDINKRVRLEDTDKHKSIYQHFVDRVPWQDTMVFTNTYRQRFKPHEGGDGLKQYEDMLRRYQTTVEIVFASLKSDGWRTDIDLPVVLIGRSGDIMLGNQGNHRVAMSKLIGLDQIPCEVICRHFTWTKKRSKALKHPDYRA